MSYQEQKLREPLVAPGVQLTGYSATLGGATVSVQGLDASGNITACTGTTVPADGASGVAKNATFIKTDASALESGVYVNVGTTSSSQFRRVGGNIYQTSVVVTAAQMLALNTTPVQIIASQGSDKVISLVDVAYTYLFGTTAYTINGSTWLALNYTNIAGTTLTGVLGTTGFIDQGFTKVRLIPKSTANTVLGTTNAAVVLTCSGANPTVGDGTVRVDATFRVISAT